MENCLFCQVIKGTVKSYVIYEDKKCISFLDHRPLFYGHCLLIPKKHIMTLYDAPPLLAKHLMLVTQKIGSAIEKATKSQGSFIAINNRVSQSVPHLHIHIVPRNKKDGLIGFLWPRKKYKNNDAFLKMQKKIKIILAKSKMN